MEFEEDLNMLIGVLDSLAFAAVVMRGTVVIAIDCEVRVRMQLRRLPFLAVVFHAGQGL